MKTVSELITKSESGTTYVLEWIKQLENTTASLRFLEETREAPTLGNSGSSPNHVNGDDGAAGDNL